MRPGEPDRTRHQEGHVPLHSFLGGVASPVSIKDHSLHALDQLLNSTNHMPRYGLGKLTQLVSTRLRRNCCNLPRDYNAFGLRSKTLAVGTSHILLEGRISDTVTVGKLSVMRTCEKLSCGTRTECLYVVWLGIPCKVNNRFESLVAYQL